MSHASIHPHSATTTSMFSVTLAAGVILCLFGLIGCSSADQANSRAVSNETMASANISGLASEKSSGSEANSRYAQPPKLAIPQDQSKPSKPSQQSTLNRKIIYNTNIGLVVKDYRDFETNLPQLVNTHGGFVANNNTDRRYNNSQSGTWIVRVPVIQYNDFLTGVVSLGFAESRKENAQDVTEEFVDIEARVKNKKQLEVRILKMLEERPGKLTDVLQIERELSRVREEIERMEGRIRFLKDRTSLATVTISCREEKEYVPAAAPTLVSRVGDSWSDSIGSLQDFGTNLLVFIIGAAPWVFALGLIMAFLYFFWRRLRAVVGWVGRRESA